MMCDFDSFDKDFDKDIFSDTFDLLEDIKSAGYDLRKSKFFNMPMDKIFDSPFFTRDRALRRGDAFSSFPRFSSGASRKSASTTESSETDSGDEVFNSRSFRRSDSTYSTSSHDTTSSGETVSEAPASRNFPRRTNIRRQIPVQHIVTASAQPNKAKLSKKLENEFLKDERHSMPHEIYSQCDSGVGGERPKSVPPKPDMLSSGWRDDGSSFQCFPSRVMESKDMESIPELQSECNVNSSQCYTNSNIVSKLPEREVHKSKCLPDILKTDQMKVHPRAPKVGCGKNDDSSWNERQQRIEGALKWLRCELGLLRAQDKVLLSQLKRCQDTIEVIKKQRSEEMEELGEEDEGHWEDWEIAEFDRRCREGEIIDDLSPTYTGNKVQEIPTNVEVKS